MNLDNWPQFSDLRTEICNHLQRAKLGGEYSTYGDDRSFDPVRFGPQEIAVVCNFLGEDPAMEGEEAERFANKDIVTIHALTLVMQSKALGEFFGRYEIHENDPNKGLVRQLEEALNEYDPNQQPITADEHAAAIPRWKKIFSLGLGQAETKQEEIEPLETYNKRYFAEVGAEKLFQIVSWEDIDFNRDRNGIGGVNAEVVDGIRSRVHEPLLRIARETGDRERVQAALSAYIIGRAFGRKPEVLAEIMDTNAQTMEQLEDALQAGRSR